MNIYVPYSLQRDLFKGEELKFAIRSIEKYLTGWEDIFLIGQAPDWFNGKVIEASDIEGRKEESIYRKMMLVDDLRFIRWDDDHYLLQRLDISEIKDWYDSYLRFYKNGSARYKTAIQRTLESNINSKNFDIHAPMVFGGETFKMIFKGLVGDFCVKSYYHSVLETDGEPMTDLKISQWLSKEEIKKLIEGRLFFSTGTLFDPMRDVLNELYPEPSKFEK